MFIDCRHTLWWFTVKENTEIIKFQQAGLVVALKPTWPFSFWKYWHKGNDFKQHAWHKTPFVLTENAQTTSWSHWRKRSGSRVKTWILFLCIFSWNMQQGKYHKALRRASTFLLMLFILFRWNTYEHSGWFWTKKTWIIQGKILYRIYRWIETASAFTFFWLPTSHYLQYCMDLQKEQFSTCHGDMGIYICCSILFPNSSKVFRSDKWWHLT